MINMVLNTPLYWYSFLMAAQLSKACSKLTKKALNYKSLPGCYLSVSIVNFEQFLPFKRKHLLDLCIIKFFFWLMFLELVVTIFPGSVGVESDDSFTSPAFIVMASGLKLSSFWIV